MLRKFLILMNLNVIFQELSSVYMSANIVYIVFSLFVFGSMYDRRFVWFLFIDTHIRLFWENFIKLKY